MIERNGRKYFNMEIDYDEMYKDMESLLNLPGDPEEDHIIADKILLKYVPTEIRCAYGKIKPRFWYA